VATHILAGGPSLTQDQVELCRAAGCKFLAIGYSAEFAPDADLCFTQTLEWLCVKKSRPIPRPDRGWWYCQPDLRWPRGSLAAAKAGAKETPIHMAR
jgi:hypothetical protein